LTDNAYDLLQQGRKFLQGRKPGEAVPLLEKAKALEPRKGSILEVLGIAYYNSGLHERAIREFEEALEVDPTNHYARYGLSRCLYRGGMINRAIGQVKLAAAMAPDMEMYDRALKRYIRDLDSNVKRQRPEDG